MGAKQTPRPETPTWGAEEDLNRRPPPMPFNREGPPKGPPKGTPQGTPKERLSKKERMAKKEGMANKHAVVQAMTQNAWFQFKTSYEIAKRND